MRRFVLLLLAVPAFAFAQTDPLPRAKPESVGMSSAGLARIGETLNAEVQKGRLPGAVVAVARKGKLVYYEAFGYLDKDSGTKMTKDGIFAIASMTKPIVAVAALQLNERGLLNFDDPVGRYLPQFGKQQVAVLKSNDAGGGYDLVAAGRQPNILDLMRHTSGMIYGGRGATAVHKLYPASSGTAGSTLNGEEFLNKLAAAPLLHQPGSTWDYGFGLDVMGLAIERISGQTLGQYFDEQIFRPLGMKDTSFLVPADKAKRLAKAFKIDPENGQPQSMPDRTQPLKFECGGGCLASTAGDYLRFAQMLLNNGQLDGKRIAGRKNIEYMLSNQLAPGTVNLVGLTDPSNADQGFGLAVSVRTTEGIARTAGSIGTATWSGAFGTYWWIDPKEKLAAVYMVQTPGLYRRHQRYVFNALVNQAIVD